MADSASSGSDQEHNEEIQVKKKCQNLTRCCPKYLCLLTRLLEQLDKRYIEMIEDQGFGAPLKLKLDTTLPPDTVRNVANCISPQGIMDLKGQPINLYELSPCVIGDPNVGDFVQSSMGHPVDQEGFIEFLKSPSKAGDGRTKNMALNNMRTLLIDIAKRNDKKEDAMFVYIYRLVVLGYINNPNTTISANLNYLGPLCTGTDYRWCDESVDGTVLGVTRWRNKLKPTITGNMLSPLIIASDLAILEGDDVNPPKGGYPRYAKFDPDRLIRFCLANWALLEFRPIGESLYIEPYYPPKRGTGALGTGTGSSHSSPARPQVVDLDYCQPAKVTELTSRLKLVDRQFLDIFLGLLKQFVCTLEADAKAHAQGLKRKLCSLGKKDDYNTKNAISDALAFISANKAILVGSDGKLNQYASDIKAIYQEMTGGSVQCQCDFTYPPSPPAKECVGISCKDLKCLEAGAWITSSIIDLYSLHLKGEHMLPELQSSPILGQYAIMTAVYYTKLVKNEQRMGELEREASKMGLMEMPFIFWPLNGDSDHWSLAIIHNEDNQKATIFHMDSNGSHNSRTIFNLFEEYVRTVLKIRGGICTKKLEVPPQGNWFDCGLFVLYNMKKFIMEYNGNLQVDATWYRPEAASSLRTSIKELIQANKMTPRQHDNCDNAKKWESSFA